MGITKTAAFNKKQVETATLAKALAHPARLAILQFIVKQEGCINEEIQRKIPLAQATISQHLVVLKEAGLVQGIIRGNACCYCINSKGWQHMKSQLNHFINLI